MKSRFTDVTFLIREKSHNYGSFNEEDKHLDPEEGKSDYQVLRGKSKLRKGIVEYKVSAHKFVLASRSLVFNDMFKKSSGKGLLFEKKDSGIGGEGSHEVIVIKDTSFKAFKVVLDYIYLDNLNLLDDINGCSELTEILKLAKFYHLNGLLDKCERQFLSLSSLQLLRNLIKNSFNNTNLKRSKEKKAIGARNFPAEVNFIESDAGRHGPPDSSEGGLGSLENQDSESTFRRSIISKRQSKQKNDNLDGVMFLADGKVLIVNNDLYQEVMKKAIIIDLKDKGESKNVKLQDDNLGFEF
jgi:hypothetical protein